MLRFILMVLMSFPLQASESDSALRAVELIDQMEQLYRGETSRASITMRIETPHYDRSLSLKAISLGDESTLIRIYEPRKDRGIATLRIKSEMWNFFPKINKVIKIPPSMMMGSWMGSDFTNDDLVKQTTLTEEYDLNLREEDGQYIIILTPKTDTVTVWGKIEYIIDSTALIPVEQHFFDERGEKIRSLTFSEPRDFSGHRLPSVLEMLPHNKTGHRTLVIYESLELDPPDVAADDFSLRSLKQRF